MQCLIGIFTDPHDNCPSGHPDCNAHHSAPYTGNYPLWEWSGVVTILSATVFSQLAGFGAPAILSPLKDKVCHVEHHASTHVAYLLCDMGFCCAEKVAHRTRNRFSLHQHSVSFGRTCCHHLLWRHGQERDQFELSGRRPHFCSKAGRITLDI